jgi:hypothetical protein
VDATHKGFTIAGNFTALGYAPLVQASTVDLLLWYKVTSAGSLIHDMELSFNGDVLSPPAVTSVTEEIFADALHQTLLGSVSVQAPNPLSAQVILSQDVDTIYVTKDISLAAFGGDGFSGYVTV